MIFFKFLKCLIIDWIFLVGNGYNCLIWMIWILFKLYLCLLDLIFVVKLIVILFVFKIRCFILFGFMLRFFCFKVGWKCFLFNWLVVESVSGWCNKFFGVININGWIVFVFKIDVWWRRIWKYWVVFVKFVIV